MIEKEIRNILEPLASHPQDSRLLWYHIFSDDVVFHCPETYEGKLHAQQHVVARQREVAEIFKRLFEKISEYDIRVHTDRASTRLSWVKEGGNGWINIDLGVYSISEFLRDPLRALSEEKVR